MDLRERAYEILFLFRRYRCRQANERPFVLQWDGEFGLTIVAVSPKVLA